MCAPTCTYTCNPVHEQSPFMYSHIRTHTCLPAHMHIHTHAYILSSLAREGGPNDVEGVDIGSGEQEKRPGQERDW